jgi:mono/diheme cytochrome c family protein
VRALLLLPLLGGCTIEGVITPPEASLERMIEQPKLDAYEASDLFENGRAMQMPPPGTIPYGREPIDPALEFGERDGAYLDEIPLKVDLELLKRGRNRFENFCATCHGVAGDSKTVVAEQMDLVKPRSLVEPPVRGYPAGRIFRVAREGFGLMPGYRGTISTHDRWAVVAYIQALQLGSGVPLQGLPPALAREAEEELE